VVDPEGSCRQRKPSTLDVHPADHGGVTGRFAYFPLLEVGMPAAVGPRGPERVGMCVHRRTERFPGRAATPDQSGHLTLDDRSDVNEIM